MAETMNIEVKRAQDSRIHELLGPELIFGRTFSDHMFVMDYENGEWTGAQITPYDKLALEPSCLVFHYGQAIFEGMKAYKDDHGAAWLFRPGANIKRFNRSAERMCMPTVPEDLFMEALKMLTHIEMDWIPQAEGHSLYIRPFMIATDEYIGVKASTKFKFLIITSPVGMYYPEPVKVKIERYFTRAVEGGAGFAKAAGNYAAAMYPAKKCQNEGYHQLIWTDAIEHKYIEESGTMNVMFVIGDTLVTPPVSSTILEGITRDSVLALARDYGMQVEERKVSVDEVIDAAKDGTLKEAFGTGTAATIAHIRSIASDGIEYELPDVRSRKFSNKVDRHLTDIKTRKAEDKFGWMVGCYFFILNPIIPSRITRIPGKATKGKITRCHSSIHKHCKAQYSKPTPNPIPITNSP